LAMQYLSRNLQFDVRTSELQAIENFYCLASKHGIIGTPRRLRLHSAVSTEMTVT
jgi:hypothetical protein